MNVSSNDSRVYFPHNTASVFHIKLNKPLILNGIWKIGVCEIEIKGDFSGFACLVCNICQGLIVDGKQTSVLRTFNLKPHYHQIYPHIFHFPIQTRFIDTIEFRLIERDGTAISFKQNDAYIYI